MKSYNLSSNMERPTKKTSDKTSEKTNSVGMKEGKLDFHRR